MTSLLRVKLALSHTTRSFGPRQQVIADILEVSLGSTALCPLSGVGLSAPATLGLSYIVFSLRSSEHGSNAPCAWRTCIYRRTSFLNSQSACNVGD